MVNLINEHMDVWTAAQTPKVNGGRGRGKNSNGQSPHGIKKLRELILELAVRGKLVPQEPNDEPASVLLEKIAEEKARLVKEGKIKKQKPLAGIGEHEKPFDLPAGWKWVYLSDIGQIVGGGTPKSTESNYWADDEIKWLTPADLYGLKGKYISKGRRDISAKGLAAASATLMPIGSILFSSRAPIGYVAIAEAELSTNQGFKSCVPYKSGMSQYIYYYLKRSASEIEAKASGTTFKEISGAGMSKVMFALPPLVEQQRIVTKVDELMTLCDQLAHQQTDSDTTHQTLVETLLATLTSVADQGEFAKAWQRIANHFHTLFTTEHSIDQLKQTILQLAIMGKLVPQDPNDEPASILLEKIAKEKARLIKEGKIKKQKTLPEISEAEKPFVLPWGMEWARLQTLVFLLGDGLHGTPNYTPGTNYYFVNGNNLNNGKIEIKPNTKTVSLEEMLKYKKYLSPNAVLVSINGTLGNVAFYNGEEIILGKSACYFNLSEYVSKHFIKIVIESGYFMSYAFRNATGSTIKNLSLNAMNGFPVPLPPIAEQHRIVAKVCELMVLCDTLKARLNDAQTIQTQLAEAIVEQAVA